MQTIHTMSVLREHQQALRLIIMRCPHLHKLFAKKQKLTTDAYFIPTVEEFFTYDFKKIKNQTLILLFPFSAHAIQHRTSDGVCTHARATTP